MKYRLRSNTDTAVIPKSKPLPNIITVASVVDLRNELNIRVEA